MRLTGTNVEEERYGINDVDSTVLGHIMIVENGLTGSDLFLIGLRQTLDTGVAAYGLRRLAKYPEEGLTHTAAIRETRLLGDFIDRMARLFHEQPCCFKTKIFNRLRRRLSGFRT